MCLFVYLFICVSGPDCENIIYSNVKRKRTRHDDDDDDYDGAVKCMSERIKMRTHPLCL